jgi:hypothetical protein
VDKILQTALQKVVTTKSKCLKETDMDIKILKDLGKEYYICLQLNQKTTLTAITVSVA